MPFLRILIVIPALTLQATLLLPSPFPSVIPACAGMTRLQAQAFCHVMLSEAKYLCKARSIKKCLYAPF